MGFTYMEPISVYIGQITFRRISDLSWTLIRIKTYLLSMKGLVVVLVFILEKNELH